jgi:hypothetical protein
MKGVLVHAPRFFNPRSPAFACRVEASGEDGFAVKNLISPSDFVSAFRFHSCSFVKFV